MTSTVPPPRAADEEAPHAWPPAEPEPPVLEAPADLVREYLELTAQRREIEERIAYLRGELELIASASLSSERPRARFLLPDGAVSARLQPTCTFDKRVVARELQRMGKLADVAVLQGPAMARFLAKEPVVAARLGEHVRYRHAVVLMAAQR